MSKFKVTSDLVVNTLCAMTVGIGVTEYSANIFFNNSYVKYFKEAFKNGQPVLLSTPLRKQFDDVVTDLKFTDFQKAFAMPFTAEGLKPVNIGCLNTRSGCRIGIPMIYEFNSIDDVSVQYVDDSVQDYIQLLNDNSEPGQKFMESLIFSEPAKKYSIARELILTDNLRILIKSVTVPITSLPIYALGYSIINRLPTNSFKIRVMAFFLLCNVGICIFLLIRTIIENSFQHNADKKVCDLGEEYIRGGIEYYDKLIQRNLVLRNIIPNGNNIYSEKGNELSIISIFSELSLTYRKKYLESRLEMHTNELNETLNEE